MISNLIGWLVTTVVAAAQPVAGVVGVTLDDAFQLVGSNSSGLVATINISSTVPGMIAGNFVARIFDDKGKPIGEIAPLAMKALDGADGRWVLLETSGGTLQKSYAAMLKANLAVVHKGKNLPIDNRGRYEFVYLVGPSVKQGAFVYLEDRPTAAGLIVGPFKVPWK
jgi:hypothetical protein